MSPSPANPIAADARSRCVDASSHGQTSGGKDGNLAGQEFESSFSPGSGEALKTRLRDELVGQARVGLPTTYACLADRIAASSPDAADMIDIALEDLIEEDVRTNRPVIAALAVGTVRQGLPPKYFFRKAAVLGRFEGDPEDVEAYGFHAQELHRAIHFYATTGQPSGDDVTSSAESAVGCERLMC